MSFSKTEISKKIKEQAIRLGFSACGISPAIFLEEDAKYLKSWLDKNMNADMNYMQNHFDKRVDPSLIVENAKSVISVLINYFPKETQKDIKAPRFSKYAYGKDYHFVVKDMLNALLDKINSDIVKVNGRCFVDSAPVLDRSNARNAGLGWIGKNTCLINKNLGSFVFIGEIIVDIELDYDKAIKDYCGNCKKCIDSCPTGALNDHQLDSRKCISYLTIEHKGELPLKLKPQFNNWVFGCDICQDVCPWNKKLEFHNIEDFNPSELFLNMDTEDWMNLDEETFEKLFEKSAVKRTKFDGLIRNIKFITD